MAYQNQGLIRKNSPDQSDLHTDREMTDFSIAEWQDAEGFVFDQVFPSMQVRKQSDKYTVYDKGSFTRSQMKKRAPNTESEGVEYRVSDDSYFADVWSLHHDIPKERPANADEQFDLDFEATALLTQNALLNREIEWHNNFLSTGVWSQEVNITTGVGTGYAAGDLGLTDVAWSTISGASPSDPIFDMSILNEIFAKRNGFLPNTLVLPYVVWTRLKNNPVFIGRLDRGQTSGIAKVMLDTVAALFEVERVIVSRAIVNSAEENNAASTNVEHDFISGSGASANALLCYVAPSVGRYTKTAGVTRNWVGGNGEFGGANEAGVRMRRIDMPLKNAERMEIESAYSMDVTAADCGMLLTNIIA